MSFVSHFTSGAGRLADAISGLGADLAAAVPILDGEGRYRLLAESERLPFHATEPLIGAGDVVVRQDMEVCGRFPDDSGYRAFALATERLVNAALARLDPPPIPGPAGFNDLSLQRYAPGSIGITPHRDHVRYRGLVAIVVVAGGGRFFVCADRSGRDAREIPALPGHVILMRGPGFGGQRDRPFHFVTDIESWRLSFGLRHDSTTP